MAKGEKEIENSELERELLKEEKALAKMFKKKNTWIVISAVLLLVVIIFGIMQFVPTKSSVANKLVASLNERVGGGVELKQTVSKGDIYEVTVIYQSKEIPVYVTKDGKYMVMGIQELNPSDTPVDDGSDTPKDVPKTDKPVVNAFVFSYCPYGLQFEKALIPVYNLLKTKVDFNIVAIGAMHGEYEHQESLREICIEKNYGKDKLFAYLSKFAVNTSIGNCNGAVSCSDPLVESIMNSLSINKATISSCMTKDAEAIYTTQNDLAASLGISGSPDATINGVEIQIGRSPDAILKAVCAAFTEGKVPSECSQTLSTTSASAGFGADAGTNSGASCG